MKPGPDTVGSQKAGGAGTDPCCTVDIAALIWLEDIPYIWRIYRSDIPESVRGIFRIRLGKRQKLEDRV